MFSSFVCHSQRVPPRALSYLRFQVAMVIAQISASDIAPSQTSPFGRWNVTDEKHHSTISMDRFKEHVAVATLNIQTFWNLPKYTHKYLDYLREGFLWRPARQFEHTDSMSWTFTRITLTGWWFQSLWKISSSVGMIFPNTWENNPVMFQSPPTRWIFHTTN